MRPNRKGIRGRWRQSGHAFAGAALMSVLLAGSAWADTTTTPSAQPPLTPLPPVDTVTVQPKLTEMGQYDSNSQLQPGQPKALYGSVTTPELLFNSDLPDFHLDDDLRVVVNRFNQSALDSTDVHSLLHGTWRNETLQLSLTANGDHDTTRLSEETSSGLNIGGIEHNGYMLQPQATYMLGASDELLLNGNFGQSFYSQNSLYTNYRTYGVSPNYEHQFDPQNAGLVGVQLSRYETASGLPIQISQLAPVVGWTAALSSSVTANVSGGPLRTFWGLPATYGISAPASNSYTFNVDFAYKGQQDTVHLVVNRQPNPTGIGTEAITTSVSVYNAYLITPRVELDSFLTYQQSSYGPQVQPYQRYYFNASPKAVFHVTDQLDLALNYQYRQQGLVENSAVPVSNAVFFSIIFSPTQMAFR